MVVVAVVTEAHERIWYRLQEQEEVAVDVVVVVVVVATEALARIWHQLKEQEGTAVAVQVYYQELGVRFPCIHR